jgi:hypothetical protein
VAHQLQEASFLHNDSGDNDNDGGDDGRLELAGLVRGDDQPGGLLLPRNIRITALIARKRLLYPEHDP